MFTEDDLIKGLQVLQGGRLIAMMHAPHVVEKLKSDNQQLRDEVDRLQAEILELRRTLNGACEVDNPIIILDKKRI